MFVLFNEIIVKMRVYKRAASRKGYRWERPRHLTKNLNYWIFACTI